MVYGSVSFILYVSCRLTRTHYQDMVDFTPYSGSSLTPELLVKILLGGVSRRVDKKGAESVMK